MHLSHADFFTCSDCLKWVFSLWKQFYFTGTLGTRKSFCRGQSPYLSIFEWIWQQEKCHYNRQAPYCVTVSKATVKGHACIFNWWWQPSNNDYVGCCSNWVRGTVILGLPQEQPAWINLECPTAFLKFSMTKYPFSAKLFNKIFQREYSKQVGWLHM